MKERILYYSSEMTDDFAPTSIDHKDIPSAYSYFFKNPIARAAVFLLYYAALPFCFLVQKLLYRERIIGRKKLKPYRKTGFFCMGIIRARWATPMRPD